MSSVTFDFRIAGIPCQIEVESCWSEGASAYCPGGGEVEFTVLDRRGYRADWLARKMTKDEEAKIFQEAEHRISERNSGERRYGYAYYD